MTYGCFQTFNHARGDARSLIYADAKPYSNQKLHAFRGNAQAPSDATQSRNAIFDPLKHLYEY
jgi:hypothetical protein